MNTAPGRGHLISRLDWLEVTADNQLAALAIAKQARVIPLLVCIVLLLLV